MKYINKKRKQWQMYLATNKVEIDQKTKQPVIAKL